MNDINKLKELKEIFSDISSDFGSMRRVATEAYNYDKDLLEDILGYVSDLGRNKRIVMDIASGESVKTTAEKYSLTTSRTRDLFYRGMYSIDYVLEHKIHLTENGLTEYSWPNGDWKLIEIKTLGLRNLKIRAYNCLMRARLETVGDFKERVEKGEEIRSMGKLSYNDVYEKLLEYDIPREELNWLSNYITGIITDNEVKEELNTDYKENWRDITVSYLARRGLSKRLQRLFKQNKFTTVGEFEIGLLGGEQLSGLGQVGLCEIQDLLLSIGVAENEIDWINNFKVNSLSANVKTKHEKIREAAINLYELLKDEEKAEDLKWLSKYIIEENQQSSNNVLILAKDILK